MSSNSGGAVVGFLLVAAPLLIYKIRSPYRWYSVGEGLGVVFAYCIGIGITAAAFFFADKHLGVVVARWLFWAFYICACAYAWNMAESERRSSRKR